MLFGLVQDFEPELLLFVGLGWFVGSSIAGAGGEVAGVFVGLLAGLVGK